MRFISAAQAIHDAYAIHLATPAGGAFDIRLTGGAHDANMRIAGCVEAGKVIAVVEAQPREVRDWLLFCHGPGTEHFAGAAWRVSTALWQRIEVALGEAGRVREKKRRALAALCMIAAQDYQAKLLRGSVMHSPEKIARLLKVPAGNYQRDYGPWIERMEQIMDAWDRQGRQAVGVLVSDERKKLEKCY